MLEDSAPEIDDLRSKRINNVTILLQNLYEFEAPITNELASS